VIQTVQKLWGYEEILVNNEKYCAKFLYLNPGFQSSFHYHREKDETFLVLEGSCELSTPEELLVLRKGQSYRLFPGASHSFSAADGKPCVILEVSTPHKEEDVVRLSESRSLL